MIVLLRDDYFGDQRLADMRMQVGPPDIQSLNVTTLDGARLTLGDLRSVVEAFPFLAERRLVIIRKLFGAGPKGADGDGEAQETRRGRADAEREREFLTYLPRVPTFTDLALVVDRDFKGTSPITKSVREADGEVFLPETPQGEDLAAWIDERVCVKGGTLEPMAMRELATLSVDDLRELDQTLESLVVYAAGQPIGLNDVRAIVRKSRESTVYTLVDAVGARDGRRAIESLRLLLDSGEAPIYLLVMLGRQVRMLLLANEALANREDVGAALKLPPWIARKIAQQARSFSTPRCLAAYEKIVAADQAIKTGLADERVAVELLVLEMTES